MKCELALSAPTINGLDTSARASQYRVENDDMYSGTVLFDRADVHRRGIREGGA